MCLNRFFIAICLLGVISLTTSQTASAQNKKPNILVIMGDDIGIYNLRTCFKIEF